MFCKLKPQKPHGHYSAKKFDTTEEIHRNMDAIEKAVTSVAHDQIVSLCWNFASSIIDDGKLPIGLLEDDSFIELITSLMGAKDLNSDPQQVRLLLLHARLRVTGCYKDALQMTMTYPIYSFTGKLLEMKDKGSFTNNGTVFQHRVVNNWVVRRKFSNGSVEFFGVNRRDCTFMFGDVQCSNLHKRCIPTDISKCETALFRTTDKLFTLVRPFDEKFLIATNAKRFVKESNGNSLSEAVPSNVFTLSVPRGVVVRIGTQRVEGTNSEVFEFDHEQAEREHADDEMVQELEREIKIFNEVNYENEFNRPTSYKVAFWIVRLSAWVVTGALHYVLFTFGTAFLSRWRGTHRIPFQPQLCPSFQAAHLTIILMTI